MPIRNADQEAVGSFALSSFEHRLPALFHKKLLETASSIVKIILSNKEKNRNIKLFASSLQSASEGVIITNKTNQIIKVNEAFKNIYQFEDKDVLGENPRIFASGEHDSLFYQNMWNSLLDIGVWSGEIINKRADNSTIHQWMSISAIKNEANSEIENYLAILTDMTEIKKSEEQIKYMAYHDSLTSLYNKTYLEKVHSEKKSATLILLNINNFSYINMAYGFEVGDKLLKSVAKILQNITATNYIFRLSSDEFALFYEDKISMQDKINSIQNHFYMNPVTIDDIVINVTFTYGASYSNGSLMQNAILALKQAKESGKNRSHIFNKNEDTIDKSAREAFINNSNLLRSALNEDRLVPFFQGIHNNQTGEILKFEVLARIKTDTATLSPFHFLEPARLTGMLPRITKIMIDKSFSIMGQQEYKDLRFTINITEDDLARSYLVDYLDEKSHQYDIDPNRVVLEILEGVSAMGKKNHIRQLNTLKREGYALAIDDFGVEYSNFERILDLDIDFLKIDAKYIKDIDQNSKSYEITKAIAYFAKNAKIPCIAEFVHSNSVQKIIEQIGIDFSQGYYFSEPHEMPITK